ncbi:MAG: cysteine hydrolase [Gammaproteobacteria bacterium]|nr:cysteine hydrolase [Gammaproteobacteria bacterium]MCW5583779.1 cysteine hydrolase [Gammaproteobacteria bacterium]
MQNLQESALLLIEFQNEWLTRNGKLNHLLSDNNQLSIALEKAKNVIEFARKSTVNIVHSGLGFTKRYEELGVAQYGLRAAIPLHQTFLENTHASQFTPPFNPQENEFVVKGRIGSSAFSASNLDSYLRNNHIKTLFIMGFALHVCVESTLRAAHDLGYESIIIDDASSAFNHEQKQYFLKNTIHHFGHSMKADDFINLLSKG